MLSELSMITLIILNSVGGIWIQVGLAWDFFIKAELLRDAADRSGITNLYVLVELSWLLTDSITMMLDYPVSILKYRTYHNSKFIFEQWGCVNKKVIHLFTKQFFLIVQRLWYINVSLMIAFIHFPSGYVSLNQSWL